MARKMLASHDITAKGIVGEGCKNLLEVAEEFEKWGKEFGGLAKKGAKLSQPIRDGFICYTVPGHFAILENEDTEIPFCPICDPDLATDGNYDDEEEEDDE
jgi:hypothetical protein